MKIIKISALLLLHISLIAGAQAACCGSTEYDPDSEITKTEEKIFDNEIDFSTPSVFSIVFRANAKAKESLYKTPYNKKECDESTGGNGETVYTVNEYLYKTKYDAKVTPPTWNISVTHKFTTCSLTITGQTCNLSSFSKSWEVIESAKNSTVYPSGSETLAGTASLSGAITPNTGYVVRVTVTVGLNANVKKDINYTCGEGTFTYNFSNYTYDATAVTFQVDYAVLFGLYAYKTHTYTINV